jgi:hypothetical protein
MEMEDLMAESRREGAPAVRERRDDENRAQSDRDREKLARSTQPQSERFSEIAREGMRETAEAAAGLEGRYGSAIAECAQEITQARARYAEKIIRHSSEAGRALLRFRNLSQILEVQMQLLRDNMQAFLDQSVKVAEAASRMAAQPFT